MLALRTAFALLLGLCVAGGGGTIAWTYVKQELLGKRGWANRFTGPRAARAASSASMNRCARACSSLGSRKTRTPSERAGRPGAAGVDVYDQEPLVDRDHPLLNMENVVCTPHLDYVERDQLDRYFSDQFVRVAAFERGEPVDMVNPDALQKR
jgi:hypothetical protein